MNNFEINVLSAIYGLIFILGVFGNLICFLVFSRKILNKIPESFYFKAIAVTDSITLIQELRHFIRSTFDYDLRLLSNWSCKLVLYSTYSTESISNWIMVCAIFNCFISLKFNRKFEFRNNFKFKLILLAFIYLISLGSYVPFLILGQLNNVFNQTDKILKCSYHHSEYILLTMDLVYAIVLPYILMTSFIISIAWLIFKSRQRLSSSVSTIGKFRVLKKDFQFTLTLSVLILLFLATNLPTALIEFQTSIEIGSFSYYLLDNAMYLNAAFKVFIYYFTHKIFRNQFLVMFGKKYKTPLKTRTCTKTKN